MSRLLRVWLESQRPLSCTEQVSKWLLTASSHRIPVERPPDTTLAFQSVLCRGEGS